MTPYQRLQPRFDAYNAKITQARSIKGWSLYQLAEQSGVSYSAVSTQSSGRAQNPKLFEQAAIADALGLSLDELLGLHGSAETNELIAQIHKYAIKSESDNAQLKIYRTIIYALIGFCALLIAVVIGYMIFDAHILTAGLFQSAGMSVFAVILAIVILSAFGTIAYAMHTIRKSKEADDKVTG